MTQQLTTHWPLFKALRQTFANTRFAQQLQLHLPQKVKATDQDSALRVEMSALEDQAHDGKARELHWKPMSWLGTSAHDRGRRLGPGDLADFLHLHVRLGGPRALLSPMTGRTRYPAPFR